MKKQVFLFITLLFVTLIGWAQGPSVTVSTIAVAPNATTAVVPIKVADANFTAVGSFSLTFQFDYANLGVPTITNVNPAFATANWDPFTVTDILAQYSTGFFNVVSMGSADPSDVVTLSEGDVLFEITFTKAGGISSCGTISFNNSPSTGCEFTGPAQEYPPFIDGTYTNGKVQLNQVYVDPAYTPGNGCNQFPTIQAAVDFIELTNDGGNVNINTGVYDENVTVTKTGINLTLNGNITIQQNVTLTNSDNTIIIGANALTLNGTIVGAGTLVSTSSSTLSIGGSGSAFGTINLDGNLNVLTVDRDAQTISLGSCTSYPIEITTLNLTAGELVLGDNALQINTTYTPGATGTFSADTLNMAALYFNGATSGAIKFSGVSPALPELYINTTGAIDIATAMTIGYAEVNTGTLTNSAVVSLKNLSNASTFTMGADLMVADNFQSINDAAVVNVNAFKLTLNGVISHFIPDENYLNAGSTSSLVINGASPFLAFIMPADIASLNNLTINRELGVTMAANLDILGTLSLTSGSFTMDGKTLSIHNPMAIASGILYGDFAAILMIGEATITPGANIALPAINLHELYINNSGGVTIDASGFDFVDIGNKLYLELGAVTNAGNIFMENNSTIERIGGSLLAEPNFLASVNILYSNTSSITSGYELPTGTVSTDVTLNGTGGVVMGASSTINSLTLTSGKLTLGAYDLTTTATTDGSSTSYVIADGAGKFIIKDVLAADVFPVGYATAYTPLTISNSIASDFSVNLKTATTLADFAAPVPSPNFVKLQWVITRALGGTATVIFNWNTAENYTTTPVSPVLGRYNGTDWVSAGSEAFTLASKTVTVTGITSFSPFAAYGDLITPVYVDDAIGSATYTGENATNSPAGTGPKKTIQQGLSVVANPGTISVAAGTYPENIIVNKDVTIEGAGVTTIVNGNDGSANGSVFYVETSGVTLKKMNIVNTIGAPISTIIDIWVISGLNYILIEENTITNDAGTGIYFAGTVGTNNVVYKNIFDGTNSGNAVETDGTAIVTGTGNYWGSDNGPYIDPGVGGVNPCGDGKHISAHISYDPWMNSTLTSDIYQGKRVISGTFTYPGLSVDKAMGTGITLILKRTIDNVAVDTTTTNGSGYYAFDGQCTNCSYYIVPSSSNPTSGAVNGTDAAQVNSWGVSPYSINVVRFLAGDVSNNDFISHTDASSILQNFVNNVPFIRTAWNFYDKVSTLNGNPGTVPDQYISVNLQRLPDYTTATAKTQDMYAMATGDFNRSFNPSLVKAASTTLELIYSGTQVKSSNQLFDLPLHIVDANSVGAISIILNFPANLVEIQDVLLSTTNEQLNWSVNGNELRIGWYSSNPLSLAAASELITLKLKTTSAFVNEASIKFALAGSPLNELADAQFNVISNAVLSVDVINASAVGISEQSNVNTLTLSNRPNPFNGSTMINYELPFDGNVSIEIYNYLGSRVKSLVSEQQLKGNHILKLDAGSLPAGVYMATLIVKNGNNEMVRTIKLICNR